MKKLLVVALALACVMGCKQKATAEVVGPGAAPDPVILPKVAQDVYFHVGALNLTVPWENVNVVYLFDLKSKTNLVGGEAVVARMWRLEGTFGAVTSLEGQGAPFLGGNLWFDNPIPQLAILNQIRPGVFGGYDFNNDAAMFGFKASMPLFK